MGIPPLAFTGISTYSADFQKILERTVAIASQPITQLQTEQVQVLQQQALAAGLRSSAANLGTAMEDLGALGVGKAIGGTSSNSQKVAIGVVTARDPATYTISDVTSVARAASATSGGFADGASAAVSATGIVELTFDGVVHSIVLGSGQNNLAGLRDKINGLGLGLTASILTTGTGATPYYLSLTANTSGERPIALIDDPGGTASDLLPVSDPGANANFRLNGVEISKPSNLINDVVAGLTFTIAGTTSGAESVTLTLATNRSKLASGLEAFAKAFNDLLAATDSQIGESAGLLTGNVLVLETKNTMRAVSGYSGDGPVRSLAELGIQFGSDGKASFDSAAFAGLTDTQVQQTFTFLGSSTEGFGAIQGRLKQLADPVTGLFALQDRKFTETDQRITRRVEELAERLTALQRTTAEKLQAVDALLGSLESQQTVIEASYKSLQLTLFGRNED